MTTTQKAPDTRGLAGQTIGDTQVCSVNQTQLIYRGFEIADLAANATFEEVAYLLLVGHKPSPGELQEFSEELVEMRTPPPGVCEFIEQLAAVAPEAHPMDVLRSGLSIASHQDPDCEDNSPEAELRKAKRPF